MCKELWIIPANKGLDLWKQDIGLAFVNSILVKVAVGSAVIKNCRIAGTIWVSNSVVKCACSGRRGLFNSTVHSRLQICAGWRCAYLCPGW